MGAVEPEDKHTLPALLTSFCNGRIPPSPTRSKTQKPREHCLSNKKSGDLADEVAKVERKQQQKKCPRS